jgi:hypothetical protein
MFVKFIQWGQSRLILTSLTLDLGLESIDSDPIENYTAAAPLTISESSWVIAA